MGPTARRILPAVLRFHRLARESVRRAVLGADDVVARLPAPVSRVHCAAGIEGLRGHGTGVLVARRGHGV